MFVPPGPQKFAPATYNDLSASVAEVQKGRHPCQLDKKYRTQSSVIRYKLIPRAKFNRRKNLYGMPILGRILKQVFFSIPSIVAFVLAAGAAAALVMTERLKEIEQRPKLRKVIIVTCLCLGIVAMISDEVQKAQDEEKKEQAQLQIVGLRQQISILVNQSIVQATAAQVSSLETTVKQGFQSLGDSSKGRPSKPPISKPTHEPSSNQAEAPQILRPSQKRVPSADPDNAYGLQIIIQTDAILSPVGLKLKFSGPIGKINFFVAGQPVQFSSQSFVDQNHPEIGVIRLGSPPISPESPLVITVLSHQAVTLVSVDQISANPMAAY
jgi:hypothetical protein